MRSAVRSGGQPRRAGMAILGAFATAALIGVAGCSFLSDLSSTGAKNREQAAKAAGSTQLGQSAQSGGVAQSGGIVVGDGTPAMTTPSARASTVTDGAPSKTVPPTVSESTTAAPTSTGGPSVDCSMTMSWTTAAKREARDTDVPIRGITGEASACAERVTVAVGPAARAPGYRVRYVPEVVADGSGQVVPLRGGGFLEVVIDSPAYDPATGAPTVSWSNRSEIVDVASFRVIQQVAYAGSFEGMTTIGIGVDDAARGFTVSSAMGPDGDAHIMIDIASS